MRLSGAAEQICEKAGHDLQETFVRVKHNGKTIDILVEVKHEGDLKDGYEPVDRTECLDTMNAIGEEEGYTFASLMCGKITPEDKMQISFQFRKENKVQIITTAKVDATWNGIAETIKNGDAKEMFKLGDKTPFDLAGGKVNAVVAHIENDRVYFVVEDAIENMSMYEDFPEGEELSWSGSDIRKYLSEDVVKALPEELAAVIKPRVIKQRIKEQELITEDVLWLPSYTELFGLDSEGNTYPTDGAEEFHFDLFCDEKSRVKQREGETTWWWTRTPRHTDSGSSTTFRFVYSNGAANSNNATYWPSVCFGFCIGR